MKAIYNEISSVRCNKYVKSFVRNHLSSVIICECYSRGNEVRPTGGGVRNWARGAARWTGEWNHHRIGSGKSVRPYTAEG